MPAAQRWGQGIRGTAISGCAGRAQLLQQAQIALGPSVMYNRRTQSTPRRENFMATPTPATRPTPERIFNALNAYQQTAALRTAIELDVFSAIGAGANTPAAIAVKTGAAEKGLRVLCDYLTVQGFLGKDQGKYALTQESAIFLDRKSPACLASMAGFLGTGRARSIFDSLTETVRNGGSVWKEGGDNTKPND